MEGTANARSFLKMPVVKLFGSQLLAAACLSLIIVPLVSGVSGETPPFILLLTFQGFLASGIGLLLGLSKWWFGVQIALPFAAFYSMHLQVPAWLWLVLFVVVFLVYRNSFRSGVPLYLSNATTWAALAELLPDTKGLKVIDLGGGLGGTSLYLGRLRPDAEILSIESAPIPAALSRLRLALSGLDNVEMRYGDFWEINLADYQVVYAFLSPVPMERLYTKVQAEMKPGTLFISNSFEVPGVEADEVLELSDGRKTKIHIWRI